MSDKMTLERVRDVLEYVRSTCFTLEDGSRVFCGDMADAIDAHLNAAKGEAVDNGDWHAPGLGEIHSRDHRHMIFCHTLDSSGEHIPDDDLATRVLHALMHVRQPSPNDVRYGRPPRAWVEAAYARFLEINNGDKDKAKTDLGTWGIGIHAAMAAMEGGE